MYTHSRIDWSVVKIKPNRPIYSVGLASVSGSPKNASRYQLIHVRDTANAERSAVGRSRGVDANQPSTSYVHQTGDPFVQSSSDVPSRRYENDRGGTS